MLRPERLTRVDRTERRRPVDRRHRHRHRVPGRHRPARPPTRRRQRSDRQRRPPATDLPFLLPRSHHPPRRGIRARRSCSPAGPSRPGATANDIDTLEATRRQADRIPDTPISDDPPDVGPRKEPRHDLTEPQPLPMPTHADEPPSTARPRRRTRRCRRVLAGTPRGVRWTATRRPRHGCRAPTATAAADGSDAPAGGGGNSLYFENWPEYIDPTEDGLVGTVERFMEATGVDMNYAETYNDNVEYFAKIQPLLGTGKTIDPDIIAPTSWLVGRLITLGWLDKLPIDQVPNVANLRPDLAEPVVGPDRRVLAPVADRVRRHRLQHRGDRPRAHEHRRPVRPGVQRQDRDAHRDARHDGPADARRRRRHLDRVDLRRSRGGVRSARSRRRTTARSAASPATTTSTTSAPATSPRASAGRATWCSSPSRTRTYAS